MNYRTLSLAFVLLALLCSIGHADGPARKKVVLIAGPKSHGPIGNGIHDYGWSVRLLHVLLENSSIKDQIKVEHHLDGWPRDPKTLDDADTIMVISDGRDGDRFEEAPHLASAERVRYLDERMKKGCGFLTFHFSTFTPNQYGDKVLDWTGGYFEWETAGKRQWYSAITTLESEVQVGTPNHPVASGLKPFRMREEFYYNIRFKPKDDSLKPILVVPALKGREPDGNVVAWARERTGGGRGFGTTCGHFYDNWKNDHFRKMVLNAIAWTAKVEVPKDGVEARFFTHEEIDARLGPYPGQKPIRVLMFAGNDAHKWHNWEKTTPVIKTALERDPRIRVEVSNDIEDLAKRNLGEYQVIVQNYVNWQDPNGLSDKAKTAFVKFLNDGGGLVVIHFANGAFHFSLAKAEAADWPEYRKIVRRVWNHQKRDDRPPSGHDAFGPFTVRLTEVKHPITAGLGRFEVTDELYFQQDGDEKIEPLIVAESRVTKKPEPLAWAYTYGKGRVFQTLLGHSEKTYDTFEAREMIRRAVAWTANQEVRPLDPAKDAPPPRREPLTDGRFGKAIDARVAPVVVPGKTEYRQSPLTAECWVRLNGKQSFNILIASDTKASAAHWELFTWPGTGHLTAYLPGMTPDHARSQTDIADGKWHHVAMVYEPERVRLFADGKMVADQPMKPKGGKTVPGDLAFGTLVERGLGCDGAIDEVRISKGVRAIKAMPEAPFEVDEQTLGLWHLDRIDKDAVEDASKLKNAGRLVTAASPAGPPIPPPGPNYQPADPKLKAVLLDRSADDVYLAVKADTEGRLFVGGREAVFVFEPDANGGYRKRTLLPFPQDSIIIGLELRGNDLYALTNNALYLIRNGRTSRSGLKAERLLWGLPLDLHVSFHCLAWGPEGDLYLNHGDPLLNFGDFSRPDHWGHWTLFHNQRDGKWSQMPYTGVGAVLRMHPDGNNLNVVSVGYRGPVGLAFDRYWNLFTNDNDHESLAHLYAPARLMHVTPHSDFAWPRGWMASKSPERSDLLEPMIATLGRGVPCGLAYYDEPFLGKEHSHSLLMGRWDQLSVTRYPLEARGASFATRELPFLEGQNNGRPVGVAVGRGGRVFATVLYLAGNVGTPHCVSDLVMITRADDPAGHPFEPYDVTTLPGEQLWADLSSLSWERRYAAHQEVLRRGGDLLTDARDRLDRVKDDDPAILHLCWLAAVGGEDAGKQIITLAKHRRAEVRLQAVRILTEFPLLKVPQEVLTAALADQSLQVQLAALAGFFDAARALPLDAVVKLARSEDTYLRQTASRLLARRAGLSDLVALARSNDPATRLAAVLAAGVRLTVPASDHVPPEEVKLSYTSGNAFFTLRYADAEKPVDLRAVGRTGSYTTAQWWQAMKPSDEQNGLFSLLVNALEDPETPIWSQAAYWLSLLRDPRSEPVISAVRLRHQMKALESAPLREIGKVWVIGPFDDGELGLKRSHPPEQGAIDLSTEYTSADGKRSWQEMTAKADRFSAIGPARERSSVYLYFRLQSVSRQPALLLVASEGQVRIWQDGRALPTPGEVKSGVPLELQPGSNDILLRLHSPAGFRSAELRLRCRGEVVVTLPEKLDSALLAARLREASNATGLDRIAPEFLSVDWPSESKKGDVVQGRKLFGSLGCVKCHAITADQVAGGAPSLTEARKRFTIPHLVESVLLPSKQVAEPFRSTTLSLKSGQLVAGLVVSETADALDVLLPDAARKVVRKADVEERSVSPVSPMPAGLVKTPQELRDLLAYMLSDNPLPP